MSCSDPDFGWMLRQLVDLGVLKLEMEPLDAVIERRLKQSWESRTCPRCGNPTIRSWESTDRVHCRSCQFKPVYTYGTPFHEKHLSAGEVLLSFMLYADTLLSISQIAVVLNRGYKTVFYAIREVEAAVHRGFPLVWSQFQHTISGPTQIDESGKVCSGFRAKTRQETAVIAAGRPSQGEHAGRGVTAIN